MNDLLHILAFTLFWALLNAAVIFIRLFTGEGTAINNLAYDATDYLTDAPIFLLSLVTYMYLFVR